MTAARETAADEWRRNWVLPFVAMLGNAAPTIFTHVTGVFMPVVMKEFGWSRTDYAAGLTFTMATGLLVVPFIGMLVDRIGPRPIALLGIPTFVIAFGSFGLASGDRTQWMLICALYAILATLVTPTVWAAAVQSKFAAGRGVALAVVLSGAGLNAAITPLLATIYIQEFGWRLAYLGIALTWAVFMLPLAFFFFHSALEKTGRQKRERMPLSAYKAAVLSRPFITLLVSAAMFAPIMLAMQINLIPTFRSHGIGATTAAGIAGIGGLAAIFGRVLAGTLIDRYSAKVIGAIAFSIPLLASFALVTGGPSIPLAVLAATAVGFALGAELDVVGYLVSRYYPSNQFGGVYGLMTGIMAVTTSVGPLLASWLTDRTGDTLSFVYVASPVFVLGSLMLLTLPKPPPLRTGEAAH